MKKGKKGIVFEFVYIILFCLKISFKASGMYTLIRMFFCFFIEILAVVSTYLSSQVINALSGQIKYHNVFERVIVLLVAIFAVAVLLKICNEMNSYCSSRHSDILGNFLNLQMMKRSATVDLEFYDSPSFYDSIESVRRDSRAIITIVWNTINGLGSIIMSLCIFIMIIQKYPAIAIVIIFSMIPSAIIKQMFTKSIYKWDLEHVSEQRKMGYLQHISTNKRFALDVRLFNLADYLIEKYICIWKQLYKVKKKITKKRTFYIILVGVLPDLCIMGIIINLAVSILQGKNTVGDYTLYIGLIGQISSSISVLINACINIYEDRLKIENFRNFDNFHTNIISNGKQRLFGDISIEFNKVSFAYPNTENLVLDNCSFKINKKEKLCIVGINGAGKSTIMKLILRFYDVTSGEILINDINIKEYDVNELRKYFSVFFQDITSYSFTLRENITISDLYNRCKNDKDIYEALTHSNALEMIKSFPNDLNQYISKNFHEEGVELSGGQYQKIALARLFYRDSKVVLLDEPSASLDPEAEHELFCYLKEYCKDRTTIFTSHRLTNIFLADTVLVIENGKVIEQGTHEELLRHGDRYAQLYRYQAEKFSY